MSNYNEAMRALDMPARITRLPVTESGFPIPWFAAYVKDGKHCAPEHGGQPDLRYSDERKAALAITQSLCWVCGGKLGTNKAFVIGPLSLISHVTAEPPTHLDCAQFTVRACPFLANPRMRRNKKDQADERVMDPHGTLDNPGVIAIATVRGEYKYFRTNRVLIRFGEPHNIEWFKDKRKATREEVLHAMQSGAEKACVYYPDDPKLPKMIEATMDLAYKFEPFKGSGQ